jgi:hypothetical protein
VFCTHRDPESSQSHSAPSAKRRRQRKNKGNISRQAWNYIDWEIRRLFREESDEEVDLRVLVNGEILDPKLVTRRTNDVVGLTEQTLRSLGTSRIFSLTQVPHLTRCWHKGKSVGPAPERPSNCVVRKKTPSALPPSVLELLLSISLSKKLPYDKSLVSFTLPYEDSLVSFTRSDWGPTLYDAADQQQDDECGSVTMTAIPIRTQHAVWHQSPEKSPVVSRRSLPIQCKTAASSAISTVSATSSCSWVNFPLRSQQSCVFMKSPAQSIQRSSMGSKACQELQSLSFKMGSLGLGS